MKKLIVCTLFLMACRGPQGDQGPQGTRGFTGTPGTVGSEGPQGPQGPAGQNGTNGTNGVDATPVTWVQFCPGVTSYPANFQEGGLCLGGNVYGVYSANNGFLTLLPPGTYNSNAIGNSCTFTLLANCKIQ